MRKKIDFKQLVGKCIKYDGLYYKIQEKVERNSEFIKYKTTLLCVADCCNAATNFTRCGFFFKECDLYEDEIDKRKLSIITEEEFMCVINKIVKEAIKDFL